MKVTRTSMITGTKHCIDLPINEHQLRAIEASGCNRIVAHGIAPNLLLWHLEYLACGATDKELMELE